MFIDDAVLADQITDEVNAKLEIGANLNQTRSCKDEVYEMKFLAKTMMIIGVVKVDTSAH